MILIILARNKKWLWQSGPGGSNPIPCKWVKQKGLVKGFDFDVAKAEQIFDFCSRRSS